MASTTLAPRIGTALALVITGGITGGISGVITGAVTVASGQATPSIRAVITADQVRFVCADGGLASAMASLRVVLENTGATSAAVPARGIDFGSERYWRAGADASAAPAVYISGVLRVSAGRASEVTARDLVVLAPAAGHTMAAGKALIVAPTGVARDGILVPGTYRARLQVIAGFTVDQIASVRRLGSAVAPLWVDAVWSEPFEVVVPPVPAALPACAA